MKTEIYVVANDVDHINALGEQGWDVLIKSPLVVGYEFDIPEDASIIVPWVNAIESQANDNPTLRKRLTEDGFQFKREYDELYVKKRYRLVVKPGSPILRWRVEFSPSISPADEPGEEECLGITFGPANLNIPRFCAKDVVDKYVPKPVIDAALASGSISVREVDDGTKERHDA